MYMYVYMFVTHDTMYERARGLTVQNCMNMSTSLAGHSGGWWEEVRRGGVEEGS